ncbi:MAG: NADPH:quinone oxidoreductase family protein [Bacteroidetes bacterium]|nr:NADPH:quinone oxidoreductase family protein [Bacteroidota bacterium]
MKAVLCKSYGPPESLVVEDIPSQSPGKGQILLEVKACGVNFPDTLIIEGKYQFKPEMPFSPGGEIAGIIKEVGEGVKQYKVGQKVFAMTGWGGFAEEVVADAKICFPIPDGMDFVTASSFSMTYGTSMHALQDRARMKEGETLLVLGAAGGVGLAAVEIGVQLGAKVIAAASTQEKLDFCREYGAVETINYSKEDLKSRIKELTDGKGVDVVYDPVGGAYSEAALRGTAWKGRYLVIGFASGEIPQVPLNLPLLKGCQIVGVFWGSFAQRNPQANMMNFMQLIQWFREGKLKPHIHATYGLEDAAKALHDILDRKVKGKVVLVP